MSNNNNNNNNDYNNDNINNNDDNNRVDDSLHEGRDEMFMDVDRMVNEGLGGGTVTRDNGLIEDTTTDTMDNANENDFDDFDHLLDDDQFNFDDVNDNNNNG